MNEWTLQIVCNVVARDDQMMFVNHSATGLLLSHSIPMIAWERLWSRFACVRASVCLSCGTFLCNVSRNVALRQKTGKVITSSLLVNIERPFYYSPKTAQKWARTGIFQPSHQRRKKQCFSHVRPDHYAIGTEDTACQGDFVGGSRIANLR